MTALRIVWTILKICLITMLLSVVTAFYLLTATNAGLTEALTWAAHYAPGQLTIGQVEGTLLGGFSLDNVTYHTENLTVTTNRITLNWYPSQLLQGELALKQIILGQTLVKITPSTQAASSDASNFQLDDLKILRRIHLQEFIVQEITVLTPELRFHLAGKMTDQWQLQWQMQSKNLSKLIPDIQGALTAQGAFNGPRLTPAITAEIDFKNLQVAQQAVGNRHVSLSNHMSLAGQTLQNQIQIAIPRVAELTAQLQLPEFTSFLSPHQHFNLNAQLTIPSLQPVAFLIPAVSQLQGALQANIQATGTLDQPKYSGTLRLTRGSFYLPALRIKPLLELQAELTTKALNFTGSLTSGSGSARLQGQVNLAENDSPVNLTLQGENLLISNSTEYRVIINPDLTLNLVYPRLTVNGSIFIPQATIAPTDFASTVTLPDETVFVGTEKPAAENPLDYQLQLQIALGDNINVHYQGLNAQLAGKVTISKEFTAPPIASGELYTRNGKFRAYGRDLTIQVARIIYTGGPLDNPGLNIRAVQTFKRVETGSSSDLSNQTNTGMQDIIVGVRVTGTVDNPQVSLFSDPATLSQGDILSYLVLGQPQSQATGNQSAALFGLLSSFNPGAGGDSSNITDELQKSLGLTELSVGSVETFDPTQQASQSTTSVIVGKDLSPNLSLHYSIGVFEPISILSIRYKINKHWSVQSETSSIDSGADVFYRIERN